LLPASQQFVALPRNYGALKDPQAHVRQGAGNTQLDGVGTGGKSQFVRVGLPILIGDLRAYFLLDADEVTRAGQPPFVPGDAVPAPPLVAQIGIAVVREHLGTEPWWYTDGVTFKCLAPDVTLYARLRPVDKNIICGGWLSHPVAAGEYESCGEHSAGKTACGPNELRASKAHRVLDKIGREGRIVVHKNHPDPAAAAKFKSTATP
jgi:hypothetical protein